MKKRLFAMLLAGAMVMSMAACDNSTPSSSSSGGSSSSSASSADSSGASSASSASGDDAYMDELIKAAQAEGEITVYGSCEDPYIAAACQGFEETYGIKASYQRLAGGEVQAKLEEENGNPSGDVWFGGTSDPQSVCASEGLLEKYEAKNAVHLVSDQFRDPDGYWYGIYRGILGIFYNKEELDRLGLAAPEDWDDLLKDDYKGLIWFSNPNTASTAKLAINTFIQMRGHDKAMEYFVALDKNVAQYTKSGGGPSKSVGTGECTIGIGFLHDAVYQISEGYDNIGMCVPKSGTACEIGATSIFKGAKHPNAAKLWIEYALTPNCVERAAKTKSSLQFLVLDNAQQPEILQQFNLNPDNTIDYDFADAKENTKKYVEDFFTALGASEDSRFKTE